MKPTARTSKFGRIHIEMIRAVVSYTLGTGLAITQSFQAFYNLLLIVQNNLQAIDSLKALVNSPITGYTAQRKAYRQIVTDLSVPMMKTIYAFAIDSANPVLAAQVNTSRSKLNSMTFETIGSYIQQVITNVTPFAGQMNLYNITQQNIDVWQSMLTQYVDFLATPRNQKSGHVTDNANIQSLIRQCLIIFHNQTDGMALFFKNSNPGYYGNYISSRKLIHTGHMSTQLRMYVTDQGGHTVPDGEVLIIGTDRSAMLNENGYALVDQIPFGTHGVTLTTPFGTYNYGPYDFKKGKSMTLHVQVSINIVEKTTSSIVTKVEETELVEK